MISLKQYILEKALERKKYLANVKDVAPVIMEHVLLIHVFPESRDVNHWKGEIKGNLSKLFYKIKSGNTKSKRKILYDYLITEYYDELETRRMSNKIFALANGKNMTLHDDETLIWKSIRDKVINMYDNIITCIADDEEKELIHYIDKYVL